MTKTLIVITGPTGVGKTAAAIGLAQRLGCDIINADSRQIYRGIPICTAAPTPEQLATVRHHFVAFKDLDESEYASRLEDAAAELLRYPVTYYSCHCTGDAPFAFLKARMGDRLREFHAGMTIEL